MPVDRQALLPAGLAPPRGVWSTVVSAAPGRMIFISGLVATDEAGETVGVGDMAVQTRQVCENLKTAVEAAGGTLADIAQVNVYTTRIDAFDVIHSVRREYFPVSPPASTMVEVTRLVSPDYLIEINAIAIV